MRVSKLDVRRYNRPKADLLLTRRCISISALLPFVSYPAFRWIKVGGAEKPAILETNQKFHTFQNLNKDCRTSVFTSLQASCASILVGIATGGQVVKCLIEKLEVVSVFIVIDHRAF